MVCRSVKKKIKIIFLIKSKENPNEVLGYLYKIKLEKTTKLLKQGTEFIANLMIKSLLQKLLNLLYFIQLKI